MLDEWKEESSFVQRMDYNADYIVYTNRKDKVSSLVNRLFQCYSEICKVKHLIQCVTLENTQNKEDLKLINRYFEKIKFDGKKDIFEDNTRVKYLSNISSINDVPSLTYEV